MSHLTHKPAFIIVSSEPITEQEFVTESNKITQWSDGIVNAANVTNVTNVTDAAE